MTADTWDYPANAIEPHECAADQTYRVQFRDDDWDFDIPGDSPNQKIPIYQAKRVITKHGAEWFVTGAERWTYDDDELIILGKADHDDATPDQWDEHGDERDWDWDYTTAAETGEASAPSSSPKSTTAPSPTNPTT